MGLLFTADFFRFARGLAGLSGLRRWLQQLEPGFSESQDWVGGRAGWAAWSVRLEEPARNHENADGGGGFVDVLLKIYIYYSLTY